MARTRGCIWLVAGVIVALLAGIVGFVTLSRGAQSQQGPQGASAVGPTVKVVTAARAMPIRTLLTAEMLTLKDFPVQAVPEGYMADPAQVVGKVNTAELAVGEIVLANRLMDPNITAADGRTALLMNENQVLVAFPASDLMNRLGILKPGDHVDLLFSMPFINQAAEAEAGSNVTTKNLVAFNALQNLTIAAVVGGQPDQNGNASQAEALLLTVSPQDALALKYLKDAGAVVDVVLRAPGAEQPFEVEPVEMNRVMNENRIPATIGR